MIMFNFRKSSPSSVDRGWAWIILLGCFVEYFVVLGMYKSFGIFFVQYQRKYNTSASVLSMILSVQNIITSISSLIVMGVGTRYFTERTMVMSGGLIGLGCCIGNAFAPSVEVLFFTQSFLFAVSAMAATLPAMLMVGKYFEKRRGMANSIANVGGSLGGFVLPFFLTFLFSEYGLEGTLIIAGGLYLQFLPAGLVMRTIERDSALHEDKEFTGSLLSNQTDKENVIEYEIQDAYNGSSTSLNKTVNTELKAKSMVNINSSQKNCSLKSSALHGSSLDIESTVSVKNINAGRSQHCSLSTLSDAKRKCLKFLFTLFDFALFKNPKFILLMLVAFLVAPGSTIVVTFIAPFAIDNDQSINMIGYLLTLSSAGDLTGRLLFVFISDNKVIQRYHMLSIAMLANGLTCLLASFYDTFAKLAVFGFLQSSFGGTYYSLINVLIVDFIGLKNLHHGLSMTTVMRGISVAITSSVIGHLRDHTGSYVSGFYLMGTCLVLGGLLLLFKPLISK
nr:monocarboxylate transporter 2 [Crassostrea gigas]